MPAVVTFWQLPEEEKAFLDYLSSTGTIMAFPDCWVKTSDEARPVPIIDFIAKRGPDALFFGLERHAVKAIVKPEEQAGETFFSVKPMPSCLLMFSRPRFDADHRLMQSNLAAYWSYFNTEAAKMVQKDPEFIKWAKKVLAWARRATPEQLEYHGFPYRATRRVKEAVAKGDIEVTF